MIADDIRQWLEELGLGKYGDVFVENEVGVRDLPDVTNEDLKELGLPLGPRRRIVSAAKGLNQVPTAASDTNASDADTARSTVASTPQAERRQLTVMFCDLVGSTALSRQLDPEDLRDVMRRYQDAVAGAVTRYGGHVAKYLGDGVLAYFGWPQAYEDQAERAVRAGLNAVEVVKDVQIGDGRSLAARVGIATGQVVVGDLVGEGGRDAEAVTGETPNLAARLQGVAEPGQVVISDTTRQLVGQTFNLNDLGQLDLKGFDQQLRAWNVVSEATVDSRFEASHGLTLTRFVGRKTERQLLFDRWELAKDSEGQVILLSGEAGIGKSRMVQAIREHVAAEHHYRLRYQCSPYHTNSAFFPIIQRLERAAGFLGNDVDEDKLDKLEELLAMSGESIDEVAPYFAMLLSLPWLERYGARELSAQQVRDRTVEALIGQILSLSRQRPVLFVLEDAHWIDPSTEALLGELIPRMADASVFVLITFRPDNVPPWPDQPHLTSIALNRLSRAQGAEIVRAVGGSNLSEAVIDGIVARGDGVPLYVEEIAKSLIERGLDIAETDIPATLQASLLARLDRLGSEAKEVAQIGAVIGRAFQHKLIASVAGKTDDEVVIMLDLLIKSELVYRAGTLPDATYTFKHALVQDAAYDSLLRARRQSLHSAIAQSLEAQFSNQVEAQPEILAYHMTEAGETEQAVEFWDRAGLRSLQRSATEEASGHFQKGIDQLSLLPRTPERDEREVKLQSNLGIALLSVTGFSDPAVTSAYRRARELCEETGDKTGLFTALWGLWLGEQFSENYAAAKQLSEQLLTLAHEIGDDELILQAHHAAWTTCRFRGEFEKVIEHTSAVEGLYDPEKHASHAFRFAGHDPGVCGRNCASLASWMLGHLDDARRQSGAAIALAKARNHPVSTAQAYSVAADIARRCGDAKSARQHADAAIAIAEEHGIRTGAGFTGALAALPWVLAEDGAEQEALAGIRAVLELPGMAIVRPGHFSTYAGICLKFGKPEDASAAVNEALELVEKTNDRVWEAELCRQKGEALLMQNAAWDEIEPCFEQAIDIARACRLRPVELGAATSLARIHADNGERDKAKSLLAPIYEWFTQGHDTPDLIEAKALLDELGNA